MRVTDKEDSEKNRRKHGFELCKGEKKHPKHLKNKNYH